MRWSSIVAMSAAVLAFAHLPALAGSVPDRDGAMRLGVEAPSPALGPHGVTRPKAASDCRRWRRFAATLGETYAGAKIRNTVVQRACTFAEPDKLPDAGIWAWPWRNGEIDPTLPPRVHMRSGAWTIRCGMAGPRERCALIHEARVHVGGPDSTETVPVTTHFVIDNIVGEQRVLWRVLGPWSLDWRVHRREPGARPASQVEVRLGAQRRDVPFANCGQVGCLMEANVIVSAEAATYLWEGHSIGIKLAPRPDQTIELGLPARGFRAALVELGRLKQHEERPIAGR